MNDRLFLELLLAAALVGSIAMWHSSSSQKEPAHPQCIDAA